MSDSSTLDSFFTDEEQKAEKKKVKLKEIEKQIDYHKSLEEVSDVLDNDKNPHEEIIEERKKAFKELKKTEEQKKLPEEKLHYDEDTKEWKEIVPLEEQPSETNLFVNNNGTHIAKQELLNLRFGTTHVYKVGSNYYGWGDMVHCDEDNIKHNLIRMKELAIKNKFSGLYKAYDSDMGEHEPTITNDLKKLLNDPLRQFKNKEDKRLFSIILEANKTYGEQVYQIFEDRVELCDENLLQSIEKCEESFPKDEDQEDDKLYEDQGCIVIEREEGERVTDSTSVDENGNESKAVEVDVIDYKDGKLLDRVIAKKQPKIQDFDADYFNG